MRTKNRKERLLKIGRFVYTTLLIVLVTLVLLEIFFLIPVMIHNKLVNNPIDNQLKLEVYAGEDWFKQYLKEDAAAIMEYTPYLSYKRVANQHGDYVNIDNESNRKTENPCSPGEITIFFFGGSTTWGTGARDQYTIPSLLSKYLCKKGYKVEVSNFGEAGYVNTQEMIKLILELQKNNYPNIVIFYDGANDIYVSHQNNKTGTPQNVVNRYEEFNSRNEFNILRPYIKKSNFMRTMNFLLIKLHLIPNDQWELSDFQQNFLAQDTLRVYLQNIKIINSLEDDYSFKSFFFWQPTLYSKNVLSEEEVSILKKGGDILSIFNKTNNIIKQKINSSDMTEFIYLGDVLNNINLTIYIDPIHISEQGNKLVAKRIGEEIATYIKTTYPK